MKFMIFNVTVMAALGYLVLSNGTPTQAITVQDIVPAVQAEVTDLVASVEHAVAERIVEPVAAKPVAAVPVAEATMPPLDAEQDVAVVPVSDVPHPGLAANWQEDVALPAEQASPVMRESEPQLMSKRERRRELARLAESMEQMSYSMLPQ